MKKDHKPLFVLIAFLIIGFAAVGAFAQESGSATAVGGPLQVLSGEIRWRKALGTVPLSAAHSDPCSAFHILVVTATQEQTLINYADKLIWKPKDGEFNICEFKMTVPSNTPIRVFAEMGRKKRSTEPQDFLCLYGGWSGGQKIPWDSNNYQKLATKVLHPGELIDPQPKVRYMRAFSPTYYDLTLSTTKGTFTRFEMVYKPMQNGTYPKYREPAPPTLKPPFITAGQPIVQPYFASVYLGWDGGPDHPNAEVWVSINNGGETLAFKAAKVVATELKLQRGMAYKYVLKDAGTTLSTVVFTVP